MKLQTYPYLAQLNRRHPTGRQILAQFDDESIVVYQAYRPEIGRFAAENGYFGGAFSLSRMSWIKPNFLWMMYRSGWGTKLGQEVILAIRLQRRAFDTILAAAVPSSFSPHLYASIADWQRSIGTAVASPASVGSGPSSIGRKIPTTGNSTGTAWRNPLKIRSRVDFGD